MNKKLIPLLFDGTVQTLGEATMKAKAATKDHGCTEDMDPVWGSNHKIKVLSAGC